MPTISPCHLQGSGHSPIRPSPSNVHNVDSPQIFLHHSWRLLDSHPLQQHCYAHPCSTQRRRPRQTSLVHTGIFSARPQALTSPPLQPRPPTILKRQHSRTTTEYTGQEATVKATNPVTVQQPAQRRCARRQTYWTYSDVRRTLSWTHPLYVTQTNGGLGDEK